MRLLLLSLLLIFQLSALAQSQKELALSDTLSTFGKVYLLVAEAEEQVPDTIRIYNHEFILIPQNNLSNTENKNDKRMYIVTEPKNATSQALQLNGQIYEARSTAVMADKLRAEGKIYVVVLVLLIILSGFIVYVVRIERKLSKLQNQ